MNGEIREDVRIQGSRLIIVSALVVSYDGARYGRSMEESS